MLSPFFTLTKKTNTVCMLARLENTNVRKRATKFCIDSNKSHHNASHRHHLCDFNSLSPKSLTYLFYCQVTSSGQCLKHVVYVYLSVLPLASGRNVLRFTQKVPSKSLCQNRWCCMFLIEPIPATNENK